MSFFLKFYVIFLTLIHPLQCSSPQSFIWSLFSSSKITNRQKFYESRNSRNIFRRLSFPTVPIPSTHPTLQLLHNRYHNPNYNDTNILGLAIEGGGMRGCVAAGAALALSYLNLTNCFDRIYGSSAGAMIGAYFISQQCQHAYDLYCNVLPDTKSNFIQRKHLFHEFYPEKYRSLYALLNLDFLLSDIMNQSEYSLDWKQFEKNEKKQKFSIIASDINSIQSIKLSRDQGNYNNKEELLRCIRASMLVPGVTGEIMRMVQGQTPNIVERQSSSRKSIFSWSRIFFSRIKKSSSESNSLAQQTDLQRISETQEVSPTGSYLVDAFICEPIPYRTAINDNCTHIVVLRTRPDPCILAASKGQIFQRIIKHFFQRYNETKVWKFIQAKGPRMIYAEDLFILNEGALGLSQGVNVSLISKYSQQSPKYVHLLPVSCQNSPEVSQIEKNSQKILDGMMDGATRVLTIFGPIVGMKEEDIDHALHEIFPPAAFTPRILFREKLKGFLRRFTRRFFRK